ncbi:DUF1758 domain-containing protein [Trichonephila clavipes]|nr:DUF1758 domain-containing protein [Trichonephila clavipes]
MAFAVQWTVNAVAWILSNLLSSLTFRAGLEPYCNRVMSDHKWSGKLKTSTLTTRSDLDSKLRVLPTNGPVIEGIDPPYQIDDVVNISCTSGPSKPTAHMKWFINDMEFPPTSESRYPAIRHPNGLQTTRIDLEFKIDHSHFYRGEIKIVCMSSIPQVYSSTSEELVIGDRGSSINPYHGE